MESPSLLITLLAFALVLGPLVMIHELGHYGVGRLFGIKINSFSIGFGRELLGWTDRRGTRWKLSMLPLGGYVQFAGDMNAASMPDRQADASISESECAALFHNKPLWQRSLVVLAGPLTNFLCAVAIFASFNAIYGRVEALPVVAMIQEGSPAAEAGIQAGDRILSINGDAITSFTQIPAYVQPFPGRTVRVEVERDGRDLAMDVRIASITEKDRFGNEARIGRIGVGGAPGAMRIVPVGLGDAVILGVNQTVDIMKMMATGIGQIFSGERSVDELGGPIKIAKYSGEQFSLGWYSFVGFAALISINLAFINLLPIPGLDGGHLALYAAQAIRRRPLEEGVQEWIFKTGMALVLGLMIFVTVNDLLTLPLFKG